MIPSFEKFMYPVLQVLKDGSPKQRNELRKACADFMGLTKEDLEEKIISNNKYKIVDRLQWATYYLLKAGLLTRPSKAVEQITPEGSALLATGITEITRQYLRAHYETVAQFEKKTRLAAKKRASLKANASKETMTKKDLREEPIKNTIVKSDNICETNDNLQISDNHCFGMSLLEEKIATIAQQVNSIQEGLISELIGIVNDFDSNSFKRLLLELIPKMGYTTVFQEYNVDAKLGHEVTMSGFVNIDELGINKFFIVANNNIEEEVTIFDVQSFIETLRNLGVTNGVYVTTSDFTNKAKMHNMYGNINIILINGHELAKLMIKYNIGVKIRHAFEIKDVDQEYLFTHLTQS